MKLFVKLLFCLISCCAFSQQQASFFFDSDKYILNKEQSLKLNQWLLNHKEVKIVGIYGFCDEEGSVGYNDTLAQKRIDHISRIIKGNVKIREDFKTRNFGKLHTLSKIKAENRKVTIYYIEPKDFSREAEIIRENEKTKPEIPIKKEKQIIRFPEKIIVENPDGTRTEIKMDTVFMRKISLAPVGEKIKLENINFYIDTYAIMPQSRAKLYELLMVLNSYPTIKIQIQGHICCVANDVRNLSTQRAKAIYKFLEIKGINSSRMTFVGFGSRKPLYPLPEKSEGEREANRRVEIEIVEN